MLLPSVWYNDETVEALRDRDVEIKYLPMAIDREGLPFKLKKKAKRFVHIAGRKTFMDRNGTDIFLASIPMVETNVEFLIYSQQQILLPNDSRIRYMGEADTTAEMYDTADVLVMPRKFGGLCLPLNEALSCGVIPLMTDCSPQNYFLADESLVAPLTCTTIKTRTDIDCFETTPQRLAEAIDRLARLPEKDIMNLSQRSNLMAELWSWDTLLDTYKDILNG
jgi:glycosyltransferase involved in cell wall biosynthesis